MALLRATRRKRIVLPLDGAFEMRTALDGDGLVDDVALDPRGGGQAHLEAAHPADDAAVDDHVIGGDLALDGRALADGQQVSADVASDVAFDRAFDLDVAGRLDVARDMQVGRQDRGRRLGLGGLGLVVIARGGGLCRGGRLRRRLCARGRILAVLGSGFVDLALRKHLSLP